MSVKKAGVWCVNEQDKLGLSAEDQVFNKAGTPDFNEDGTRKMEKTFHEVDSAGQTVAIHFRGTWEGLRRVPASDIPAARIQGVSKQQLADLGYETFDDSGKRVEPSALLKVERPRVQVVSSFTPAQ
jgi:hypothetical protein